MPKNVTVQGASFSDVPGLLLPETGGGTAYFVDTSDANATAADIDSGKTAYVNGVKVTGTGSGGGGTADDVIYIDYDGTVLHQYSKADFLALSAHPSNPSHTGLTAQGWNWKMSDAKTYVATYGMLVIGQMYVTASEATEIDIELQSEYLSPCFSCFLNGTINIDWGDGSALETQSAASTSTLQKYYHTYATAGSYTIKIHCASGVYEIQGNSSYGSRLIWGGLNTSYNGSNDNAKYDDSVKAFRAGKGLYYVGTYTFLYCHNIEYITLSSYITAGGTTDLCRYCYNLKAITIPDTFPKNKLLENYAFEQCYALKYASIPKGGSNNGSGVFRNCIELIYSNMPDNVSGAINTDYYNNCVRLKRVAVPTGYTTFAGLTCCVSLDKVVIHNTVTSIYDYALQHQMFEEYTIPAGVTTIGAYAFGNNYKLKRITIPAYVTRIGNFAFTNCYSLSEVHMKPTTPPTAGSSLFSVHNNILKIYVPSASLDTYKAASNWSTYADYMVGE